MTAQESDNSRFEVSCGCRDAKQEAPIKARPAPRGRPCWLFWFAAAMLAAIVAFHFMGRISFPGKGIGIAPEVLKDANPTADEVEVSRKGRKVGPEQRKLELEKKRLLADVEKRIEKYRGDVAATVERYRKMIPLPEAEAAFRKSEDGASFIASKEGLCGFKCCVSLAYKMAYDKVKGTARAEDAISPILKEKIVDEIEKAVAAYARWTADFRKELAVEEASLAADLAAKGKSFESAVSVLSEENAKSVSLAVDSFSRDVRDHACKAAGATVGLALETVMVKTSYAAIKNVVIRLAGVALSSAVKRAGASLAAGGAAAVVDGPLPIGDIIGAALTVGGLSWTAYDIYVVTKTMPDEMNAKIREGIVQTRKALEEKALENLQKAKLDCEASAEQKLSELNKILKGG